VTFDLQRFIDAQDGAYEGALRELRAGRKTGHWIWFIFPQLAGLGRSSTSMYYAIASLEEAQAYLAHPVLGPRLRDGARLVLDADASSPVAIFGELDALKVRSSMTLFHRAAPREPIFPAVLDRYFGGEADPATDALLAGASPRVSG
jgi:uncharacterized protein (DUF1810 family)